MGYKGNDGESVVFAHPSDDYDHDAFFSAYTPQEEDGCYLADPDGDLTNAADAETVCWWHMSTGQVLGVHNGMVLEYDSSTLAPLGLVVGKDELMGRKVTVVQPNEDGSYWRKIVRNKVVRMKEKRREAAAKRFIENNYKVAADSKIDIQSSWGPYISTSGTAKKTTVPGVTSKEKLKL